MSEVFSSWPLPRYSVALQDVHALPLGKVLRLCIAMANQPQHEHIYVVWAYYCYMVGMTWWLMNSCHFKHPFLFGYHVWTSCGHRLPHDFVTRKRKRWYYMILDEAQHIKTLGVSTGHCFCQRPCLWRWGKPNQIPYRGLVRSVYEIAQLCFFVNILCFFCIIFIGLMQKFTVSFFCSFNLLMNSVSTSLR